MYATKAFEQHPILRHRIVNRGPIIVTTLSAPRIDIVMMAVINADV